MKRAARHHHRARIDRKGTPWRSVGSGPRSRPNTPVARPRSTMILSANASEITRAPCFSAVGRYDTSTDILALLGQPKLQRALPIQPSVLRRVGGHRNAKALGPQDELLGGARTHVLGYFHHANLALDVAVDRARSSPRTNRSDRASSPNRRAPPKGSESTPLPVSTDDPPTQRPAESPMTGVCPRPKAAKSPPRERCGASIRWVERRRTRRGDSRAPLRAR